MKKSITLFLSVFYALIGYSQLYTGSDPILQGKLHVVYSGMNLVSNLSMISNIFVLKGVQDTVWIFGSGLGDAEVIGFPADTCDIRFYQSKRTGSFTNFPTNSALYDAQIVDTVIVQEMGINRTDAVIQFLVPHLHADHVNQEFFTALDSIGYQMSTLKIYVDIEDSMGTVCNEPCCGVGTCDESNPYFAAPYDIPWSPFCLNRIKAIGSIGDTCNIPFWSFNSDMGEWKVTGCVDTSMGGHTQGTINLDNHSHKLRLLGSNLNKYAQCDPLGSDWTQLNIHSNITYVVGNKDNSKTDMQLKIFPNPSKGLIYFDLIETKPNTFLYIYDLKGSLIKEFKFNGRILVKDLNDGLYIYVVKINNEFFEKGKFVMERR